MRVLAFVHSKWKCISSSDGYWVPEMGFRFWKCSEIMGRQVEQGFTEIFAIYDAAKFWKITKYNVPKIWWKMKKSLIRLALNQFFDWFQVPAYQILGTQYPSLLLITFSRRPLFTLTCDWPVCTLASSKVLSGSSSVFYEE